ncbi:nicotinate mononucleotide-dependent phosphoribosyltransferase CobT [Baaleninema sp.]|uniref:nicotinate mononucleotide-dependent phosphoribosyltransferase CobT n=1 Tax=Baaleninema sp. TaxID=3101197 RepID=UPI003D08AB04
MIRVYTQPERGQRWLEKYRGTQPAFACVFGFTETALLAKISAAGRTPADRRKTALADAEYLLEGEKVNPRFPLPPLAAGASPAVISRAVVRGLPLPMLVFDGGLPEPLPTSNDKEAIALGGQVARCVTTGQALDRSVVEHLFEEGLKWGDRLSERGDYLAIGECVVGGTTTALSVLLGLGFDAEGLVNSSYPQCNHDLKREVVQKGLQRWRERMATPSQASAMSVVAAVGDPMQIVVAGMAIALSRRGGVLLAGGTQMLAVYALARALVRERGMEWCDDRVVVGTTRWVAEDPTGSTVALAKLVGEVPLLATQLNLSASVYPQLQAYERGFVKEGVGAGGCAIAASLSGWTQERLREEIDATFARLERSQSFAKAPP